MTEDRFGRPDLKFSHLNLEPEQSGVGRDRMMLLRYG